jgi:hypothetical protein
VSATEAVVLESVPISECHDYTRFDKRMDNWRRTVRGSLGGGRGGFCATWARWYVICRTVDRNILKTFIEPDISPPRMPITVDELDGWLVEAAVRTLPNYDERKVLQFWHVFQSPEHWITKKLMLRRSSVMLVKGRAEINLQKVLRKLESANNLHSSTLYTHSHAGNVPRPETKVALDGAALSLETEKASIE